MQMSPEVPIIVANWKMNPQTEDEAVELLAALKRAVGKKGLGGQVVIAPPAIFLSRVRSAVEKMGAHLAVQAVSSEKMGAFTGEYSVSMVQSVGVTHVIAGHSERRARGETDESINLQVTRALKANLSVIVCVGEKERDVHGRYFGMVEEQVRRAFAGVPASKLASVMVAYEPVWAISTSSAHAHPATPEDAHEMILFIRKVLTDLYGRTAAERARILYGGSVDQKNIAPLVARSGAQGYLVGGASLRPYEFAAIVETVYG